MKKINVEIREIKVSSFSPARDEISFAITFNDGKEKEITRALAVAKGEDAAVQVIRDIRRMESTLNAEFDGKMILDNYSSIIIKDEAAALEKMKFFFSKVFEKAKVVKNQRTSDGYMKLVSDVSSMKLAF